MSTVTISAPYVIVIKEYNYHLSMRSQQELNTCHFAIHNWLWFILSLALSLTFFREFWTSLPRSMLSLARVLG